MADKKIVELLVSGGQATGGPPLGPALGPLGVNVMIIVNKINELTKDYAGMNHYAAKTLGFKPLPKKDEILVADDLTSEERRRTIRHEIVEMDLMKKGLSFWDAHKTALKKEGLGG